jgi:protein required for attachment to host cells
MQTTWILSANAGRARFFTESSPNGPLVEVEDMLNSSMRQRMLDTISDKIDPKAATSSGHGIGGTQGPGQAHNAKAGAPNKDYQPAQTPDQHQAEQFARDISRYLVTAHQQGRFQQLFIAASPEFLGTLRACLDPQIAALAKQELNKDYTQLNAQQLQERLHEQVRAQHAHPR